MRDMKDFINNNMPDYPYLCSLTFVSSERRKQISILTVTTILFRLTRIKSRPHGGVYFPTSLRKMLIAF